MQVAYSRHYFFTKFTLNQLFSLGAHVGHLKRRLNKSMSVFLLGFRGGLVCIDLNFTIFFLRRALNFLRFVLKSRGSIFFFITNWAPLRQYFKMRFSTRLHFWYSGPFLGGLLSNLRSTRYSNKVCRFGNFFKTKILVPEVAVLFDSSTFFYIYRDAFLLGIPSIGFVDTDLDYQSILYPIVLNNSGIKVNFLYSVFFLNVLKQEQFLERFFLLKNVSSECIQKKDSLKKRSRLFFFFLYQFIEGSSLDLGRLRREDLSNFSKTYMRIRFFTRQLLLKRIRKFRRSQTFLQRRLARLNKVARFRYKLKRKYFFFDAGNLFGLQIKKESLNSALDRRKYDGSVILRRLRRRRIRFFFVKSKLLFLRGKFSKLVKIRNLNFRKSLFLLRSYRHYLVATVFSKRLIFRRLIKKLQLSNRFVNKLCKLGNLHKVFRLLNIYFLRKDKILLRRLHYISTRVLTLLASSRRKATVMISRLSESFSFNQALLVKDFPKKPVRKSGQKFKIVRKVKLKGGFLVVKRCLFRRSRARLSDFSNELDIKALKRMRLRHARDIIEAKDHYYTSRRSLYDYNNLLNSRFKTERSMFKNLSGLIRKGLFRRSQSNDRSLLKKMKKPYVIYSEINPKSTGV